MRFAGAAGAALVLLALAAGAVPAGLIPTVVSADLTLQPSGNPWLVSGNVLVRQGATLTLEAGVVVEVTGNWLITVEGSTGGAMVVEGAAYDSVYLRPSEGVAEWRGIYVSLGDDCSFDYMVVLDARRGLELNTSHPPITHCAFRRGQVGIWCRESSPAITSSWVSETTFAGIVCHGETPTEPVCRPVIEDCNLFDNAGYNVYALGYTWPGMTTITATRNWWGSDDPSEIAETIFDANDPGSGDCNAVVNFADWLAQTPVEPTTWGRLKALYRD